MNFVMTHSVFTDVEPVAFTNETAPAWLTSANTRKGSTMDNRWLWEDRVLSLAVGASIETDFHKITRVS